MKISIVISTHPTQFSALAYKADFKTNVAKIAELGYEGVELAVRDPRLVDMQEIERIVRAWGLVVPAIGTGQAYGEEGLSLTDPDESVRQRAVERIKDHIEFAVPFQALVIIGLIRGKIQDVVSQQDAMSWLQAALQECAAFAQGKGVRLVLEPLNRYETNLINTVAEAQELIERLQAENLGILFDTFHANIEESSICKSIFMAGNRLFHVHVADSNRWYPGAGHIDFARIVTTLRNIGYSGFLSAEVLPKPAPHICARRTIENLQSLGI